MPASELPSVALEFTPADIGLEELASRLSTGCPAVVGHVQDEALLLDLRTVFPGQDAVLTSALRAALGGTTV